MFHLDTSRSAIPLDGKQLSSKTKLQPTETPISSIAKVIQTDTPSEPARRDYAAGKITASIVV